MGLPRHAKRTWVNLQYFDNILRKKSGIKFVWFKFCSYNLLYIQCSPTIDPFPLSIWNPYPYLFHHLIVCLHKFIVNFWNYSVSMQFVLLNSSCSAIYWIVLCNGKLKYWKSVGKLKGEGTYLAHVQIFQSLEIYQLIHSVQTAI